MNRRLSGKVALVTGAGRHGGLGEAIALRFALEGATVVLTDIGNASGPHLKESDIGTTEEMEKVAEGIKNHSSNNGIETDVKTFNCDVRNENDVHNTIEKTVGAFGKLDIVVNNAGVGFIIKPLIEMTQDDWDLVLDVNLRGPFFVTKHAGAAMTRLIKQDAQKGGRIINIASRGAKNATPNYSAYASSKHGLLGLTRVSAIELAPQGITVNAVCPNHVTTGLGAKQNEARRQAMGSDLDSVLRFRASQIPLGRVGLPSDTAAACAFLASDDAAYITGDNINVSGGEEMH